RHQFLEIDARHQFPEYTATTDAARHWETSGDGSKAPPIWSKGGFVRRALVFSVFLTFLALPSLPSPAWAAYAITQSVIAGGGGTSAGGTYSVTGTIGQSVLGVSSGGSYTVSGGFWGGGQVSGGGLFDVMVLVTLAGSAAGTVGSSPGGISCPPTCTNTFN